MPRDSNGNVTLPVGNPVVSDSEITSDWANTTLADIATMMQDSLSRTGDGGMQVPFQNLDGTTAAPGMTFTNDTGTGFSRSALGLALSLAGTLKALFASALATFKTSVKVEGDLEVTGGFTTSGVLTRANLPTVGQDIGAGASFSSSSLTGQDISDEINLPTASGRPVMVMVQTGATSGNAYMAMSADAGDVRTGTIMIYRKIGAGAYASVASYSLTAAAGTTQNFVVGPFLDTPGAGSISYKLVGKVNNAAANVYNEGMVLVAYEM